MPETKEKTVGFFDKWLHGGRHAAGAVPVETVPSHDGYTVVDVETTGLSARRDRVLEIAVVRTDVTGRVTGEWSRRVDPEGPVGATHIHGITAADVVGAPKFAELVPHLNDWLRGTVVVAHNARFDLAFLRSEYTSAGWELPWLPSLCTLEASSHYFPRIDRRRLADCCAAARVPLRGAHSALGDARATAALLNHYLNPRTGVSPYPGLEGLGAEASSVIWPTGSVRPPRSPGHRAHVRARIELQQIREPVIAPALVELLADFSLIDALDEGAPEESLPYLEKLAEALEDGEITAEESQSLDDVAQTLGLGTEDRQAANRSVLLALAHLALQDGVVSRAERSELVAICTMLTVPPKTLTRLLNNAESARHERLSVGLSPLPTAWSLGDPLRVGDKVAFTGCDEVERAGLESRAERLGVRVMGNVSSKTAMLVTDGGFSGTKAAAAAAAGSRLVHPRDFATLLDHLQPAVPRARKKVTPMPSSPEAESASPPETSIDPATVRQWARDNGYAVGTRGRLHASLFAAYEARVSPESSD